MDDECLDCEEWRQWQGPYAHCLNCTYKNLEEWREARLRALQPKKRETEKKPIAHQPVKRAVKPRRRP